MLMKIIQLKFRRQLTDAGIAEIADGIQNQERDGKISVGQVWSVVRGRKKMHGCR